ncbi:hypothetical protein OG21DRAFT_1528202, partial [Imleria badia]
MHQFQVDAPDLSNTVERRASDLPTHNHCLPQCYRDDPPPLPIPVPALAIEDPREDNLPSIVSDIEMDPLAGPVVLTTISQEPSHHLWTASDENDLFHEYPDHFPSHDPVNIASLEQLCDGPTFQRAEDDEDAQLLSRGPGTSTLDTGENYYFRPFMNATIWRLLSWFYNSATQKSLDDLNNLIHDVILADDFKSNDLHKFNAWHETKRLDNPASNTSCPWPILFAHLAANKSKENMASLSTPRAGVAKTSLVSANCFNSIKNMPRCYCDDPPPLPIPVPALAIEDPREDNLPSIVSDIEMDPLAGPIVLTTISQEPSHHLWTASDENDLFHEYPNHFPSHDPVNIASLEQLCDGPTFQRAEDDEDAQLLSRGPGTSTLDTGENYYFRPFMNATIWRLLSWFYNSATQKSLDDLNNLIHDVILADDFKSDDLHKFNAWHETKRLDDPAIKQAENIALEFCVEGLHYRKITKVVKSAFEEPAAHTFHHMPYKLFWQPDKTRPPERVITELYTSDAMLEEYEKINSKPPEVPGCNLETVIAAIMLWSDSTHLASFGNAALWPIYLLLRNQSKYTRAKP